MKHSLLYLAILLAAAALIASCRAATRSEESVAARPMAPPAPQGDAPPPTEAELRERLTPLQYEVTRENGTEPPFENEYWNNKQHGIYVDVVSGEPLFTSLAKYDSGTGWPSFTQPAVPANVVSREERSWGMTRTEVRSKGADSHLGHVFDDGPQPTGLRYCINSAALRFVPLSELAEQGYGKFVERFEKAGIVDRTTKRSEVAILAGGCFWGMEEILRGIDGVVDTEVGYTGGSRTRPGYDDVKGGRSGHAEAVRIRFDPRRVSYRELLGYFFRMHDPTTVDRQGNDRGSQYRSAIFTTSDVQRRVAEQVRAQVDESGKWQRPVVTAVVPATRFWPAEDSHQDYLQKRPGGYTCHYLRE